MTLKDWDDEVEKLTDVELLAKLQALDTLRAWVPFEREFKGFGTFALRYTLLGEMAMRARLSVYEVEREVYGEKVSA